jgi:hypothetical protein
MATSTPLAGVKKLTCGYWPAPEGSGIGCQAWPRLVLASKAGAGAGVIGAIVTNAVPPDSCGPKTVHCAPGAVQSPVSGSDWGCQVRPPSVLCTRNSPERQPTCSQPVVALGKARPSFWHMLFELPLPGGAALTAGAQCRPSVVRYSHGSG